MILVATTGTENINLETESDRVILKTAGQAIASRNVAAEPWFIGLMCSIALLLIILINVCVLVRERGGKYSVQEKEPFQDQMHSSEEPGFDEYQKRYYIFWSVLSVSDHGGFVHSGCKRLPS